MGKFSNPQTAFPIKFIPHFSPLAPPSLHFYVVILIMPQEFVDYYTAISLSAPSDEVFTALMKHCWNI